MNPPEGQSVSFLTILEWLFKPIPFILNKLTERTPFLISSKISGQPVIFTIEVVNKTKDFPLNIHEVRLHTGLDYHTWYFKLSPKGSQAVSPRNRIEFQLPRVHAETTIGKRSETTTPPDLNREPNNPPFNTAADLFKIMSNASPKNVWIEVDFNEYKKRQFLRGSIQVDLAAISTMNSTQIKLGDLHP